MFRKPVPHEAQHTEPDHRPMIPELRGPKDPIDLAVRSLRTHYEALCPLEYKKWR